MRTWVVILVTCLLLVNGCARAPVDPPKPAPGPATPTAGGPRLVLQVSLGDEPDQPGHMPGRVGGISPRGPLTFAAEWGHVFLADQAKGRVLWYDHGRLNRSIPAPWLDEHGNDLRVTPLGLVLTVPGMEFTVEFDGRLRSLRALPLNSSPRQPDTKDPVLLGKDPVGNRFEYTVGNHGPLVRRVSPDGAVQAAATLEKIGPVRDWNVGRDGSLYALIEGGTRVYEVIPTVTFSSPAGGADPAPPPNFLGRPIPSRLRLQSADRGPNSVLGEIDRWNVWQLLASAYPAPQRLLGDPAWRLRVEADFPDGTDLVVELQDGSFAMNGTHYAVGSAGALHTVVESLYHSQSGLQEALAAAESVQIALEDLPGVARELTPAERQQLQASLTGAVAVSPFSPPQPLERPFPLYAIRLKGLNWERTLLLAGERHLLSPYRGAVLHSGRTAALVKAWLPVPELKPDQVGYLYLADKLEVNDGGDLTRWKATVVRRLAHARFDPAARPTVPEPLTFTFRVKGEQRTVQVDSEGFTYGGKRFPGSGLTDMAGLQGVP